MRIHSKTIDAGSGYLCQMEPVAHYGIRKNENDIKVEIKWTNGSITSLNIKDLNKTYEVKQNKQDNSIHLQLLNNNNTLLYE